MRTFIGVTTATAVRVAGLVPGTASAAHVPSDEKPTGCPTTYEVDTFNFRPVWKPGPGERVKGLPGQTITITVHKGDAVTTGHSTSSGSSAGINAQVLAYEANRSHGSDIAVEMVNQTTFSVSDTVPRGVRGGWMQWGSWGQKYSWRRMVQGGDCTWRTTGSGTAHSPVRDEVGVNRSWK